MTRAPYRLTVIGSGHLGTTHAACLAELGHEVLALDRDADRVTQLSAGHLPFYEPELAGLLRRGLDAGRLRFTTAHEEVAEFGDVHFLCVDTPQQDGEFAADLTHLEQAVTSLAPLLQRKCLLVGKSTVPAGTAEWLAKEIARLAPADEEVELAWNPEFLREGHAVRDTLFPDRIVAGVASERAELVLREIYAPLIAAGSSFIVTDHATAELVKAAANAFLATKISFINAMADVCEAANADVTKLSEALAHDERIGGKGLAPGLGFGGGCLPKDIRALRARASELGADQALALLGEVDAINTRRRTRTVELAREVLGGSLTGRRVAVLGAAFKPGSDDTRDSPALEIASAIHSYGGVARVYDPVAVDGARRAHPELEYADSAIEAARNADAVLHLTEWQEFRDMDPTALGRVVAQRNVIDARAALDPVRWRAAGWRYRALGGHPR